MCCPSKISALNSNLGNAFTIMRGATRTVYTKRILIVQGASPVNIVAIEDNLQGSVYIQRPCSEYIKNSPASNWPSTEFLPVLVNLTNWS